MKHSDVIIVSTAQHDLAILSRTGQNNRHPFHREYDETQEHEGMILVDISSVKYTVDSALPCDDGSSETMSKVIYSKYTGQEPKFSAFGDLKTE